MTACAKKLGAFADRQLILDEELELVLVHGIQHPTHVIGRSILGQNPLSGKACVVGQGVDVLQARIIVEVIGQVSTVKFLIDHA